MRDASNTNGDGRDDRGRFAPGSAGGPGRPRRSVEFDYLKTMADAVPPERWGAIVEAAVEAAEGGDDKARAWLSRHLLPAPGGDVSPLERWREIVAAAVEAAEGGDDKARAWLSRHLLPAPGGDVSPLVKIAAAEAVGEDAADDEVRAHAGERQANAAIERLLFAGGDD